MSVPRTMHKELGPKTANFFIITVSTSRYHAKMEGKPYTDESGDTAEAMVKESGHRVVGRELIKDDIEMIRNLVRSLASRGDVDVIVLTGGTGLARSDVTIEALRPLFEKEMEGFGDIFRYVSYSKIGTGAIMTRATAGVINGKLVVALPGSPDGVKTGLEIILQELPHILYIIRS
ncbi:MogA/MoaB family molybdenum cofactor biosynthesis protein [Vulcanisaeta thermophila]|uniref:MogA/MoaB family molybdenum cofactor biosynthesis protein n=1 Tax=Vulcanisaeta thermophila TaxID=867917 RepID=UPI000852D40C|nr:MogA/MoaB family molybdenum cofactor biosynthesis protein [Vulcanisaeta thermophila]